MNNININDFVVSDEDLKDLGLDNDIIIPSIKDDIDALNGASDFEEYISLDTEDNNFVPGFEDSSSFDSEDYGFDILS
tara:strand:- start:145 stop:378 length:234 start_codon:yes stop_codon:yes gene_type:complete